MTLPLNIALNNSFSSKHNLNDELDITTLMTCQISPCVTDTDFSIESKVGDNILLLLRLSDNASVLLMPNYNIDILTLVLLCLYVSYH